MILTSLLSLPSWSMTARRVAIPASSLLAPNERPGKNAVLSSCVCVWEGGEGGGRREEGEGGGRREGGREGGGKRREEGKGGRRRRKRFHVYECNKETVANTNICW